MLFGFVPVPAGPSSALVQQPPLDFSYKRNAQKKPMAKWASLRQRHIKRALVITVGHSQQRQSCRALASDVAVGLFAGLASLSPVYLRLRLQMVGIY